MSTDNRLRERLLDLRDELVTRMRQRGSVEPAHLGTIANCTATLAVLDALDTGPHGGGVEIASNGSGVALTVRDEAGAVVIARLSAADTVRLAGRMLDAVGELVARSIGISVA